MENIAVLCGGGKAPGWPAGIKAVTETAEAQGFRVLGVEDGYKGLTVPCTAFRGIHEYMDTRDALLSARSPLFADRYTPFGKKQKGEPEDVWRKRALQEFHASETRQHILDNLRLNRIKFLIGLGGDDTMKTMALLMENGVLQGNTSPKTVDNDVTETLSFGHLTAGQVGRSEVDGIREEARTYHRVGIVEAMGRGAVWLAQQHHNADIILPAHEFPVEQLHIVERVRQVSRDNGVRERRDPDKGHAVVVVPEGFLINGEETFVSTKEDPHGHKRLGGVGHRLQQWFEDAGMQTTYQRPGYRYRFEQPTGEDAALSYALAKMATEQALAGNFGVSSVARGRAREVSWMPLEKVHGGKGITKEEYDFDRLRPKSDDVKAE